MFESGFVDNLVLEFHDFTLESQSICCQCGQIVVLLSNEVGIPVVWLLIFWGCGINLRGSIRAKAEVFGI